MADDGYRPRPPQDDELRNAIERLAVFVAKNGPDFEKMTMEKQEGNPKFAFLYGGPFNEYYRFCVEREVQNIHGGMPPHPGNGCLGPPPQQQESEFMRRMNSQKEQLRQQITDSERNLKAHHDAIPTLKEAQVAQAVILSETQKMTQILANVNFDVSPLGALLDQLNGGKCSKDLVSTSRKWIFEHCQTDQLREVVLTYLLSRVKDSNANDNFRLNVLYVINDWAYQCQRKRLDSQTQMLSRYVPQMYAFTVELSTDGLMQQKLDKLIGVWEGHKYFNDQCFKQLRNPGQIYNSAKAVQAAEYAKLAVDIENNLQAMYSGYEEQHKNYVQHIMQQIAKIDMQIDAEKDRARGAIPSLLSGMTRDPLPMPGGPGPGMSGGGPGMPGPGPSPGLGPRRSRFDQQPSPMQSKSQEDYGTFFAPPPRAAPKQPAAPVQGWIADEGIPDGDDIDGHPFNEEDLIPSVKYFELPAGIMLPVIEIEQFAYTALVPDKLRMPPPVPPSQRLLSALDEFYSASLDPTREPPLAAWGRGGCTEFMERKQRLKKILEDKLKSENKTLNDLVENKPSEEELKIEQENINAEIKMKYEEMRKNALKNEEKEQQQQKPSSASSASTKRKRRSRSRRRSTSSSSSSSRSRSSSSSSTDSSSSSRYRSRSRSYSPMRSRSRSRSASPGERPSFGARHRSPSPVSFDDSSRFRMPPAPLSSVNKGAQLMQKMGWSGTGLGASKQGIVEPIGGGEVRDRQDQFRGLGSTMDVYEQYRKQRSGNYHDRNQANFVTRDKDRSN
ncbi:hypothetical protein Q1695_011622 [Nippostrongylus brasiliensis]|nr:hypothetical protein Q1695_011622 [Nippostrongylus brasiliensis]